MNTRIKAYALAFLILAGASACGRENQEQSGQGYTVYYVNQEGTGVVSEKYVTDTPAEDKEALLQEFTGLLQNMAEKPEYISPLPGSFQSYTWNEGQVNLDFKEAYLEQDVCLVF